MFGRYRFKTAEEFEKYNKLQIWSVVIIIIILFVIFIKRNIHESKMSAKEKQLALDEAPVDYEVWQLIKKRHDECFKYNYYGGGKFSSPRFNRKDYRKCLDIGLEKWLKEKRKNYLKRHRYDF